MANSAICYGAVVYNRQILCSHQSGTGNYETVFRSVLPQVQTSRSGEKTAFNVEGGMTVYVLVEQGVAFCVLAPTNFGKQRSFNCLDALKRNFESADLFGRVVDAGAGGLSWSFGNTLQMQMEKHSKADGSQQVREMQSKVDEVKDVMVQNVKKVMDRGEKLDDLMDRAEDLEIKADQFRSTTKEVRKKFWWQNMRMKLIIAASLILIITVIVIIILASTGVFNGGGGGGGGGDNPKLTTMATTTTNT